MSVVLTDKEQQVRVSADHTSMPMEEWLNFFLICCQNEKCEWSDFSSGVKAGVACMYISGECDSTVYAGMQLMVMQMHLDLTKETHPAMVYALAGDWEWYCAEFLHVCTDDVLIQYCINWAEFGASKVDVIENCRLAINKREEVITAFKKHCADIGIMDYLERI